MVVSSLFDWMIERHSIYLKREAGKLFPWTEDRILREHRFTNVFRELDKVTAWMRKNFTDPNDHKESGLMVGNCATFRYFNTIELMSRVGWMDRWSPKRLMRVADKVQDEGVRIFTNAYFIPTLGLCGRKAHIITENLLEGIWANRNEIAEVALDTRSLEATHKEIGQYYGWGGKGFMAYEVVSDLRFTNVLRDATDIMTWANPGPGCRKGLNRLYGRSTRGLGEPERAIREMRELLGLADEYWPEEFPKLEMRDIEHSLCEFGKYEKLRLGEGHAKNKYKPPVRSLGTEA